MRPQWWWYVKHRPLADPADEEVLAAYGDAGRAAAVTYCHELLEDYLRSYVSTWAIEGTEPDVAPYLKAARELERFALGCVDKWELDTATEYVSVAHAAERR